ncbi:MAG TPA: ABC transporter substrate-binding protein [Methylomirabilota bacterium]|jgi:phospholipid transport system substrate-binding protein|nr:ABC transporter substrate-binding protein [Methylomirabilota bacterium]
MSYRVTQTRSGRVVLTALALLASTGMAAPAWAATPRETIQGLIARVSAVLADPALEGPDRAAERRARVGGIIHEAFDFPRMAPAALGAPWEGLSGEQRAEFTRLFGERFGRSYSLLVLRFLGERTTTYAGEAIQGQEAVVRTRLESRTDGTLPVEYRLVAREGGWGVADVVVDGVSLTGNYRTQFSRILRTTSYDTLLARMRRAGD